MFGSKKNKKSPEEIKREREEKIRSVEKGLKLQIVQLNKKKDNAFAKVVEARNKGLTSQEKQARGLLKQTMAASKRAEGMLMTLELAMESRDLAELNTEFLKGISVLSDDIVAAGKDSANVKPVEKKYKNAMFRMEQQKDNIDQMIAVGEYSSAASVNEDEYTEFDDEIDSMLDDVNLANSALGFNNTNRQKF